MEFNTAVATVAESVEKRRCLPFIGAGVSAWNTYSYPDDRQWQEMIKNLHQKTESLGPAKSYAVALTRAHEIVCQNLREVNAQERLGSPPTWFLRLATLSLADKEKLAEYVEYDLSTLAEEFYREDNKVTHLTNLLIHFFGDRHTHKHCTDTHRLLALMPFERIATTNYDSQIETAHRSIGAELDVIADDSEFLNSGHVRPQLFKIHGDFGSEDHPEFNSAHVARKVLNKIVLTDSQYWNFPNAPGTGLVADHYNEGCPRSVMVERIRTMMLTHHVVFLGYSLTDFNIIELFHNLSAFQHKKQRPLLITHGSHNSAKSAAWRGRGFDVVFGDLNEFVEAVWNHLYGKLDPDDLMTLGGFNFESDARFEIPIRILLKYATENPNFKDKLRQIAQHPIFPETLIQGEFAIFPERIQTFVQAGWLRKFEIEDESRRWSKAVYFQFIGDIREKLRRLIAPPERSQ